MKRKHQKTLERIYKQPTSRNIQWTGIESLSTKGAIASIRKWLESYEVQP